MYINAIICRIIILAYKGSNNMNLDLYYMQCTWKQ